MVRWCIYLRHIAGKYDLYSEILGAFHFPRREHYVITHTTTKHAQDFLLVQMKSLFEFWSEEWQKIVILLIDEMYIKENIVYNKHTGRIVGFTDLGDVNHLLR